MKINPVKYLLMKASETAISDCFVANFGILVPFFLPRCAHGIMVTYIGSGNTGFNSMSAF